MYSKIAFLYACTANSEYIILKWHLHVSFRHIGTASAGGGHGIEFDRSVNPIVIGDIGGDTLMALSHCHKPVL